MLLSRYDFYDIYAVLIAIRHAPDADYNEKIVSCVKYILSADQKDNCVDDNIVRKALRAIGNIDKELFSWVFIDNVYTYGQYIIKDMKYYIFLANAFEKLDCLVKHNSVEMVRDLVDALHNIPIYIADGCNDFKKTVKKELSFYSNKYKQDLWKDFFVVLI